MCVALLTSGFTDITVFSFKNALKWCPDYEQGDVCNARTVLPLWAVVVPVNVCNATRYGVRGQRYDNSVYHDGPFVPQGSSKSTVVEFSRAKTILLFRTV